MTLSRPDPQDEWADGGDVAEEWQHAGGLDLVAGADGQFLQRAD